MTAAAAKAFITDPAGSTSAQDVRDAIDVIYADLMVAVGDGAGATLVGSASASGASPLSLTVPAGTAEGDIVILAGQTVNSIPNVSGPSGGTTWNEVYRNDGSTSEWHVLYWKVAGPSEPASWGFTHSAGSGMAVAVAVLRTTAAIDAVYSFAYEDNTFQGRGVVGHPEGLQVVAWMTQDDTTLGAPVGDDFTAGASVAGGTDTCQALIMFRDTIHPLDAPGVRAVAFDNQYGVALNMVLYPSGA